MPDVLDLGPLDRGLARLEAATSGPAMAPRILREGEELAEAWRQEIQAEGLIRTGAYHDSISVRTDQAGGDTAGAIVATDLGYPNVLEHGSRFIRPRPVATRAFLRTEEKLIDELAAEIARAVEE